MQFLEDITHPPAVGAAIETPAEAANRRGAHWVALPDDHDLLAPLARLVSARDGHRAVPFHIVVGLLSRVLRLPAVVDVALAAVSTIARSWLAFAGVHGGHPRPCQGRALLAVL